MKTKETTKKETTKKEPAKKVKPEKEAPKKEAAKKEDVQKAKVSLPSGPSPYQKKYTETVLPALIAQFQYKNVMQAPRLKKIVVNTSLKEATLDRKILEKTREDLMQITGQRPVLTLARKSIANFKLRKGQPIGCCVTLRNKRMYEFLNRLVNTVIPRVRDFKGVSPRGFDGRGNYTLGMTEHTIFHEISYDRVEKVYGMNISFVTTAKTNEEGRALLKGMGMPFRE